jgi:hypothetical protein
MGYIELPNKVMIHLVDFQSAPIHLPGVIFGVYLFATQKSDFHLGPFVTDAVGTVTITRAHLDAEVLANYDSGLMDYAHVNSCRPKIEIRLWNQEQIDRALEARRIWRHLLKGERERWDSIEELREVYQEANNGRVAALERPYLTDQWDKPDAEYEYNFPIKMTS